MPARRTRRRTVWSPQPGPQSIALTVPYGIEQNLGGARGGGKTDTVIGLWLQHWSLFGARAKGLVLRTEFKQLRDFRDRAREVFARLPKRRRPKWVGGEEAGFRFPGGAKLTLGHVRTVDDAEKVQGWSRNFLACEELTNWPDPEPVNRVMAVLRDATIPTRFVASCNPGGPGHNWVKDEWIDPAPAGQPFDARDTYGQLLRRMNPDGTPGPVKQRVHVRALVRDNPKLLRRDPDYVLNLRRQAPHVAKAWEHGDWDIAPGAFLEGVWDPQVHRIADFQPPLWWHRFLAIDWGTAAPYSVGWYTIRRDDRALIRYREAYGWGGKPNVGNGKTASELAELIHTINAAHGEPAFSERGIWKGAVCDVSMFSETGHVKGAGIATELRDKGIPVVPGPSFSGSRVATLALLVSRLRDKRFLVCDRCTHWLRTAPLVPRDLDHPEDADTEAEDHALDESRYAIWYWTAAYGKGAADPRTYESPRTPEIKGFEIAPERPSDAEAWADAKPLSMEQLLDGRAH